MARIDLVTAANICHCPKLPCIKLQSLCIFKEKYACTILNNRAMISACVCYISKNREYVHCTYDHGIYIYIICICIGYSTGSLGQISPEVQLTLFLIVFSNCLHILIIPSFSHRTYIHASMHRNNMYTCMNNAIYLIIEKNPGP